MEVIGQILLTLWFMDIKEWAERWKQDSKELAFYVQYVINQPKEALSFLLIPYSGYERQFDLEAKRLDTYVSERALYLLPHTIYFLCLNEDRPITMRS